MTNTEDTMNDVSRLLAPGRGHEAPRPGRGGPPDRARRVEGRTERLARTAIDWAERGRVPDFLIRAGIRRQVRARLRALRGEDAQAAAEAIERFIERMDASPIAPLPHKANEQHYELPAAFFGLALGPHRKYSCSYWPPGVDTLARAEAAALAATCERADLRDGHRILELGCGWGALTLWIAQRCPRSRLTAVSNSRAQRDYIAAEAKRRGCSNVQVLVSDMNGFEADGLFDRIVSVEMFEHMRNWRELYGRIARWLAPDGRFFKHVFCHRSLPYAFEDRDAGDWMSRHFFSGGMMPSDELPLRFQGPLVLSRRWRWDGTHYQRTAEAWLDALDRHRAGALALLDGLHGTADAPVWLQRWRMFFMACAELFGHERGQQWWVGHYLFERAR